MTERLRLTGQGEVYSFTHVLDHENGVGESPYTLALVKLDEGPVILVKLTDLDDRGRDVNIGTRVELVVRKLDNNGDRGAILYGQCARPILVEGFN